ncbi:hypothetical protein JANAI62_35140 [Jannaschia pagri]|uniref:Hedgehog/Intein (Hint) domain-containing protein n=1 Tax=Jannaschia pagri TaxID=2829797 RepID=A0ABQ4NR44_9RHOB|nr:MULTISPECIES: Hint domain-containing protein [unclassified Jannaschia]GIT93056.1 hypothetical protein JANAI61_35140 [Jannaschia sp. AI_61]GIT96891.1 hypothetical protein JANAI62_35140 [Jannaschia sp. AI_62]
MPDDDRTLRAANDDPGAVGVPILDGATLRHAIPARFTTLTASGAVPLRAIQAGTRLITRDRGMMVVRRVLHGDIRPGAAMVHLPIGVFGDQKPGVPLDLPPDQPVVLRGWRAEQLFGAREARVAVGRLVDGRVARLAPSTGGRVVSLVLDQPVVFYVEGMEVVSAGL